MGAPSVDDAAASRAVGGRRGALTRPAWARGPAWIFVAPALILGIGVFASIQVAHYLDRASVARDFDRFRAGAERSLDRMTDRIAIHEALLRGVAGLIRASGDVVIPPERFATYIGRLNLDTNYPGVQGIGYSMALRDDAMRAKALGTLTQQQAAPRLWPEHSDAERHAIVLLYPPDLRNQAALGYDMFVDPTRREALLRARDDARPALTAQVTLVQEVEPDRQPGFLMYVPVYFGVGVPDRLEVRRSRFIGVVYSPFRARDFLSAVFAGNDEAREFAIALHDGPAPDASNLLYRTDPESAFENVRFSAAFPLNIAGRRWTAVVAAREPFYRLSPLRLSQGALATGLIGSLALAALAFTQARAMDGAERARDALRSLNSTLKQRIAARTRELEIAREALIATNMDLEATVTRRNRQLRESTEEAQRFVYVASHDLRAPLVNIVGFTGELAQALERLEAYVGQRRAADPDSVPADIAKAIAEDIPEAVEFIRGSTARMDRLIKAILTLAREGRRALHPEVLQLDLIVDAVVAGVHTQVTAAKAEIVVEKPLPELVGDRLAVEQILANLVENAVKYLAPDRPGRIVVRGRTRGARVEIEVEDNGRGIDPRDHERIFELFRRAGPQDTEGEGLGLAHVRALARRMDGGITVSSQPGQGARFVVDLPRNLIVTERGA